MEIPRGCWGGGVGVAFGIIIMQEKSMAIMAEGQYLSCLLIILLHTEHY